MFCVVVPIRRPPSVHEPAPSHTQGITIWEAQLWEGKQARVDPIVSVALASVETAVERKGGFYRVTVVGVVCLAEWEKCHVLMRSHFGSVLGV